MANKKRLISAKEMERQVKVAFQDNPYLMGQMLRWIRKQPTVDAVEVVHGRWIDTGKTYEDEKCRYNYWECSECNKQIAGRYGLHNYCPNCGADMRERKDDERKD